MHVLRIFFPILAFLNWCRTWWHQPYMVVVVAIVITLVLGLSASGLWIIWKRRDQALVSYKPVDNPVDSVIAEQELQPLRTEVATAWWIVYSMVKHSTLWRVTMTDFCKSSFKILSTGSIRANLPFHGFIWCYISWATTIKGKLFTFFFCGIQNYCGNCKTDIESKVSPISQNLRMVLVCGSIILNVRSNLVTASRCEMLFVLYSCSRIRKKTYCDGQIILQTNAARL